jgi:hypothetical protein
MVFIGIVTRAHATQGEIFVRPQNGFEIDELHDVLITSKTNGDLIKYDSATGLWKNAAQSTLTIAESQVTNLVSDLAGKAATVHTHTKSQITDFAHTHPLADLTDFSVTSPALNQFLKYNGTSWTNSSVIDGGSA